MCVQTSFSLFFSCGDGGGQWIGTGGSGGHDDDVDDDE